MDAALDLAARPFRGLPRTFWVLWAGMAINRLGTFVLPLITIYLTREAGLSLARAGLVVSGYGAGSLVANLIGGSLADRVGRRATMLLSLGGSSLAMVVFGQVRGFEALAGSAFVLGVFSDMYRPAASAVIADVVPPERRLQAFSLVFWVVNLGFAAALALGGALAERAFAPLFWIDAATTLAFGLVVAAAIPETRPPPAPAAQAVRGRSPLLDPIFLPFLLFNLVLVLIIMQFQVSLPEAMRQAGRAPTDFGLAMAVNGLLIVALQPGVGGLLTRARRSVLLGVAAALIGVGFSLVHFASSLAAFAGTVAVWTLGEILMAPVNNSVVADLAPDDMRGRYQGAFALTWSVGFLVAPSVGPLVLERAGSGVLWGGCAAAGLAAAVGHLALGPARARRLGKPAD